MKHAPDSALSMLTVSVRALSGISAIALWLTRELRPAVLLSFALFFVLSWMVDRRDRGWNVLGRLQPLLGLAVFALATADFVYASRSFLLAVAHFLLGLQGVRLLSLKTPRENFGGILIASLMMLSAATLAIEWTFFMMLLLFLPLVIWALILHNIVIDGPGFGSAGVVAADKGESWRERTLLWLQMIPHLRTATALAFFVAVFCCALVFVFFPRFNFHGFRGQFLQPVRQTGFTNHVDLEEAGKIFSDETIAMRVEIPPEQRALWTGYVRGGTLDAFDGKSWQPRREKAERVYASRGGNIALPGVRAEGRPSLRQSIYLESMDTSLLFAVKEPARFVVDRPFLERSSDGSVRRPFGDGWRLHYQVESYIDPSDRTERPMIRRRLDASERRWVMEGAAKTAVPDNNQIRSLLADVIGPTSTDLGKAERLEEYLRSNYAYTLDLSGVSGNDPLGDFLFRRKSGHCEYFASAMCVLLRHVGIPSRMVTGFHSSEWNDQGGYFIVRMRDAHAWVEAWIEPWGWTEFDPSPRRDDVVGRAFPIARRLTELMDYLNLQWNRHILSYDMQKQVALFLSFNLRSRRISGRMDQWVRDWRSSIRGLADRWRGKSERGETPPLLPLLPWIFLPAFVAAGIWVFQRFRRGSGIWFYEPLRKYLEGVHGRKSPGQTILEFGGQAGLPPKKRDLVRFLIHAYYKRRFGPSAPSDPVETATIKKALRDLRR